MGQDEEVESAALLVLIAAEMRSVMSLTPCRLRSAQWNVSDVHRYQSSLSGCHEPSRGDDSELAARRKKASRKGRSVGASWRAPSFRAHTPAPRLLSAPIWLYERVIHERSACAALSPRVRIAVVASPET